MNTRGTVKDKRQATIGVIGGMSWESTALYYQLLNTGVRDRLGGLHSAKIVMASVDFADIEEMQRAGEWEQAGQLLADHARDLVSIGAEVIVLATNTMHKVAAAIETAVAGTDAQFLHIGTVVADAVAASGSTRVGLLGTRYTMEHGFYRDWLEGPGLDVIVPDKDDRDEINLLIFEDLCQGVTSDEARQTVLDVIDRLVQAGAEGIILGCTELELLIGQDDVKVPVYPSSALHCAAAVDASLARLPIGGIQRYELNYDWSKQPGWNDHAELTLLGQLRGSAPAADAVKRWYDELPDEDGIRYEGGANFKVSQPRNAELTILIKSRGQDAFDTIAHYASVITDLVIGAAAEGEPGTQLTWTEQPIH